MLVAGRRPVVGLRALGGIAGLVLAVAVAGCSGSSGTPGAQGQTQGPAGQPTQHTSSAAAGLPFADTCSALTAADFTALGLTLKKADHGLSDTKEFCFYQVADASGTTASPSVGFLGPGNLDGVKAIYAKDVYKYQALSGIGDAAFSINLLGHVTLYVQAKGQVFSVEAIGFGEGGIGSADGATEMKALAKAIVGRL
jgi:hypothetical protein